MERKDVMAKNVTIYKDQASALGKHASKDVKVLVVANPANTNAVRPVPSEGFERLI